MRFHESLLTECNSLAELNWNGIERHISRGNNSFSFTASTTFLSSLISSTSFLGSIFCISFLLLLLKLIEFFLRQFLLSILCISSSFRSILTLLLFFSFHQIFLINGTFKMLCDVLLLSIWNEDQFHWLAMVPWHFNIIDNEIASTQKLNLVTLLKCPHVSFGCGGVFNTAILVYDILNLIILFNLFLIDNVV